ncbi:MAG: methionyl-tRNA formyltransferase [Rhodospirillales bacterium]|nr:methionyl-tRNA formyltransferase [Rhodospirillales bacterium]MBO6787921.1 methionyl-tRNA formyltransferase [Rhodospirillales bacterium]
MGSPEFSIPTLHALIDAGHDVVCVYAQPPKPAGRGHKETPCPVHAEAIRLGIEARTPKSLRDPDAQAAFHALDLDCAIVVAYGLILPEEILTAPRLGCLNVHASLLPRWRGAAPIQRAIMAGDAETGVGIMKMDVGLDTGDVLAEARTPIGDDETASTLHDRLSTMGAELLTRTLSAYASGDIVPVPQPEDGVTYAHKLERGEGRLDFTKPAVELERTVRALNPWPGTWFEYNGERFKVAAVDVDPGVSASPGTVVDDRLTIACADGGLRPRRVQRPGKSMTDVDAFLRGYGIEAGTHLA